MDDDSLDRWRTLLSESEELLARLGESADPVAQREIAEALSAKAAALDELGRFAEAVAVWDESVRRFAVSSLEEPPRLLFRALLRKALDLIRLAKQAEAMETVDALLTLCDSAAQTDRMRQVTAAALRVKLYAVGPGRPEESIAVDEELISRFADSSDAFLHEHVTAALQRKGLQLLRQGEVGDAVLVARALAQRLDSAPEGTLAKEAGLANRHAQNLTFVAAPSWRGAFEAVAFTTVNAVRELPHMLPGPVIAAWASRPASPVAVKRLIRQVRITPARWEPWRTRMRAAIELSEAVVTRASRDPGPDPARAAMIARVNAATARMVNGQIVRGARELVRLIETGDEAAVQAFQSFAADVRGRRDAPGQIRELSMLGARAMTLGQDDSQIVQIAYDDSVRPVVAETTHRPVRWIARFLRPSGRS